MSAHACSPEMTRRFAFFLGLALGVAAATLGFFLREALTTKAYTVQSVSSHYAYDSANSQTELVVYRKGETGHVMKVKCAFPPGFRLPNETGWRVRVTRTVSEEFLMGGTFYVCSHAP